MEMEVKFELRLCKVGEEIGYFHTWEHYAKPIEPGFAIGSHPGGQLSICYGVVEFPNRVTRVDPSKIIFCDDNNRYLNMLQRQYSKDLSQGYDPFKPEVSHATKP